MNQSTLSHIRFLFFGTPAFAVPAFQAVHALGAPLLCVTNPDELVGRKQVLTASPVKQVALQSSIHIIQPRRLDDQFLGALRSFQPDIAVLAAYGKIIPPEVLAVPRNGFVNIHPSLLPKYRGASPVVAAILAGEKETGVTIMKMDERLDHGPILAQRAVPLDDTETMGTLTEKLGFVGAAVLLDVLPRYLDGKLVAVPQDGRVATMTHVIHKDDAHVDWKNTAVDIERQTRAYHPWPVAWTLFHGKMLQLHRARIIVTRHSGPPGELMAENRGLIVSCGGASAVELLEVQMEGKRRMSAAEFSNGNVQRLPATLG